MDIRHIASFLKRFKNITPPERDLKKALKTTLQEELQIEVLGSSIEIRNKIIYVHISPTVKSEIFLHKDKILKTFHKKLSNNSITDIR